MPAPTHATATPAFDAAYLAEPVFDTETSSGFASREIDGDFIFTVELRGASGTAFGLQAESGGRTWRLVTGADGVLALPGAETLGRVAHADVFQLERRGDTLLFSAAVFGAPLQLVASVPAPGGQPLRAGVYRGNGDGGAAGTGVDMRNARWTVPAWPGLVPYRDYLGSRLELLDLTTGAREVIFATAAGIEAPNYTPDGRFITFNSGGLIFRLEVGTHEVTRIDTGQCIRNNNDHVISPDGRWLGISNHASGAFDGQSIVYKLPIEGGEPVALTRLAPSYLHGWSPDGCHVIYTGKRDGAFDIYRTATDGAGEETRLTDAPGLNDGSEYAPDGRHIYFNSSRTGRMQLWRMDADGGDQRALTDDAFNNWFPHPSPDGRTIVFLSYQPDMQADKHPYYQHVYLRAIPAEGGAPRVVAYLYGGQGTINVPSWSPDGRYVAFVSHTGAI
jgi:TolB protein